MEKEINFSKSKSENKYIFKEKNKREKMEIDCTNLSLNGKTFYEVFFANGNFNKGDTFKLESKIKNPSPIEKHIFEKIKELFNNIQNELNK